MNINCSLLGNGLWATTMGGLVAGACLKITQDILKSSATEFSISLLRDRHNIGLVHITLSGLIYKIYTIVGIIFNKLGWQTDDLKFQLANISFSLISSGTLAYAGAKGNPVAAYIITCSAIFTLSALIIVGLGVMFSGLKDSYHAIAHP